jgi:hypothetical protein
LSLQEASKVAETVFQGVGGCEGLVGEEESEEITLELVECQFLDCILEALLFEVFGERLMGLLVVWVAATG